MFSKPVKSKSNEKQVIFSVFLFYGPQGAADISTALFPSANSVSQSKRMLVKLIGDSRLAVDPYVRWIKLLVVLTTRLCCTSTLSKDDCLPLY